MEILYEDADIVAINKPAGLVTHSDGRTEEPTAEEWFKETYPDNTGGYVHRIDRDTSGILVFAKNQTAYEFLRKAFHDRDVHKVYLAIVYGAPIAKKGSIDFDIGRSRADFRLRSAQPKAKGRLREALTRYEVLAVTEEAGDKFALLRVAPETGRTHQIRVHLKAIHHPIVADPLYGGKRAREAGPGGIDRLALHAYQIDLPKPSLERVTITAPVPEAFRAALATFGPAGRELLA